MDPKDRKYLIALTHRQVGYLQIALRERWVKLDQGRKGMLPPDDEEVIEEQRSIEAIEEVLRMASS